MICFSGIHVFIAERETGMENDFRKPEKTKRLSKRELEVFRLLLQGMSNSQIASTLGIARKTVEEHLTSIYIKLGVKSRTEAILWDLNN
jgi:DNA-binding NarL/FixJ family response regulator